MLMSGLWSSSPKDQTTLHLHQVIVILVTLYLSQLPGEHLAFHNCSADVLITHISVHRPDMHLFNV